MEQRDLGKTGLKVSALGYGAGSVGGLMVRGDPAGSIRRSCLQSLQRLGRGAVDLLQFHNQVVLGQPDGGSGISLGYLLGEVADGLQRLVRDGLADHVGFTGLGDPDALHEAARSGRYETV